MMDHTYIKDQLIVERYVKNSLDQGEREAFEEHFFTCSDCMDEIDRETAFQRDFKRYAVEAAAQAGVLAWLSRFAAGRRFGFACMVLVIISLSVTFNYKIQMDQLRMPGQVQTLRSTRSGGSNTGSEVVFKQREQLKSLIVPFEVDKRVFESLRGFQVRLREVGGDTIWLISGKDLLSSDVQVDDETFRSSIVVSVSRQMLPPGSYEFVFELETGEPFFSFHFSVRRP